MYNVYFMLDCVNTIYVLCVKLLWILKALNITKRLFSVKCPKRLCIWQVGIWRIPQITGKIINKEIHYIIYLTTIIKPNKKNMWKVFVYWRICCPCFRPVEIVVKMGPRAISLACWKRRLNRAGFRMKPRTQVRGGIPFQFKGHRRR